MNKSLLNLYYHDITHKGFTQDSSQEKAIQLLNDLSIKLKQQQTGSNKYIKHLKRVFPKNHKAIHGLYLYGGVGRGKTYMMDLFVNSLRSQVPIMRTHFHRFMQKIHHDLHKLKGNKQPINKIVSQLSKQYRVLCLDELFVNDIGDAMILGNLFTQLTHNGVTLIITSNAHPTQLYKDGLQRELFLPAIDHLIQHVKIVNVDSDNDYRMRDLQKISLWYMPLNSDTDSQLYEHFTKLTNDRISSDISISVLGRNIQARHATDDAIWFDFKEICDGPRSQNDYIEIAKQYNTVFVSNIPVLDAPVDAHALRFIYLVDEFYDRNIKLVISAAASSDDLYTGNNLKFAFERTKSRLHEMQSIEYQQKCINT